MEIKKKYKRDARAENAFDIELFLDKETNKVSYLDKNRIPKEIAPASEGGGSGDFLTTTVTVTAADFLGTAPGDTVKVLIPPVGAGKYLRLNTLVGKFKNATVAYDTMPVLTVATELSPINNLISLVSLGTTEEIVSIAGNNVATGINGSIYLQYKISGSTPTVGDGDVIFEIEYKILDF